MSCDLKRPSGEEGSELSQRSSGDEKLKFWLPSLSSKSSHSTSSVEKHVPLPSLFATALQPHSARPSAVGTSTTSSSVQPASQPVAPTDAWAAPTPVMLHPPAPAPSSRAAHLGNAVLLSSLGWGFCRRPEQTADAYQPHVLPEGLPSSGVPLAPASSEYVVGHMMAQFASCSSPSNLSPPGVVLPRRQAPPAAAAAPSMSTGAASLVEQVHRETNLPVLELKELADQGILQQVPRNESGELSSVGSISHAVGKCSPCLFWYKKSCVKGLHCSYCHIRHPGQKNKRIRPSKKTRMQRRGLAGEQASTEVVSQGAALPLGEQWSDAEEAAHGDGESSGGEREAQAAQGQDLGLRAGDPALAAVRPAAGWPGSTQISL
mmetsp:Transcript_92098/g.298152  ORF Transcript_92098/g.298152 Transcript_92098/m.298152 type:complete len:376 (-) Transcript_92098:101-1228(-)